STELRLAGLTEPEITELVASLGRLPEAPWGKALPSLLLQASRGSPLGILEGIRMSIDSGLLLLFGEVWTSPDPDALLAALREVETIKRRVAALSELERHVLLLTAIAGVPIPQRFVISATQLDAVHARKTLATLEQRGFIVADGETISPAHDAIAENVISQASAETRTAASAELGAVMSLNEVTHWRLRAIPHLVEAQLYSKAAAVAAPMLRSTARRSSHVDARLKGMLGSVRAHDAVSRVKSALPLTVKRPLLIRQLGAAAFLLIVAGGAFAAKQFRTPVQTPTQLVVLTQTPEGDTEVRKANLDLDHWDPARPLSFSSIVRLRGWIDFLRSHVTPRPGSESWAVYSIYPDSGQGDIDLVDLHRNRTRLTRSPHDDRPIQFSPDGRELLFLTTRWSRHGWSDIAVLDMKTRQIRRISSGEQKHDSPHWSPDGTRIAYNKVPLDRAETTICVADADGSHTQCGSIAGWTSIGQIGWIDAHRLVVAHDGTGARGSVSVFNVDKGTAETSQFPRRAELSINPDGEWALVSQQADGVRDIKLAPTTRFDLARVVTEDSNTARFVLFGTPGFSNRFVDSLAIERGQEPLPPNVPVLLTATAWSNQRRRIQPAIVRWRSLTPSIATIDSLGVLVATDTGKVVVELSAGGWRRVIDTVQIGFTPSRILVDERWKSRWKTEWRAYGDPEPIVVEDSGKSALLNNGDGNFFSGVYYRHTFSAANGIAMDMDLSTPITRTQWQMIQPGLQPFTNLNHIERWDHKTGYLTGFLNDTPGCNFSYPAGEGDGALTGMPWYASMRSAINDSSFTLSDGRWYHARLQIFPSGRCGIAINGYAVFIGPGLGPLRDPVLPIIQGHTVDTRVLVGHVVIRSGVPDDVDWTKLAFDGFNWIRLSRRSPVSASRWRQSSR
ncbi:MAG TPA: hypothetical protein VFT21_08710, partial [Gemmatimonadaceae bacterium]|nr:hypothetical protein [Gemmatimonadaceae bacterium]